MNLKLGIKSVEKAFGKHKLLDGCSYAFGSGVTAIMGPNGCGKSTLLRICALLEEPTAGRVAYFYAKDKALPKTVALMRKITLVLPKGGIFDSSVWGNVMFGLRFRRLGWGEKKKRAQRALEAVGLLERRKQHALGLSSGETQRLALARALALQPEVLLLDEPTSHIDEENAAMVERIILNLKSLNDAPTIIMTTHDKGQAERLADKAITIKNGKIALAAVQINEDHSQGRSEEFKGMAGDPNKFFVDKKFFGGGLGMNDINKIGG